MFSDRLLGTHADKAERLLARRLDQEAPGVAASILEGLDEILTVTRLKLPTPLRRSLACTNAIENMMGTVRSVCRNVKRWRNADGAALDGRRHAGSNQGLPSIESPAGSQSGAGSSPMQIHHPTS